MIIYEFICNPSAKASIYSFNSFSDLNAWTDYHFLAFFRLQSIENQLLEISKYFGLNKVLFEWILAEAIQFSTCSLSANTPRNQQQFSKYIQPIELSGGLKLILCNISIGGIIRQKKRITFLLYSFMNETFVTYMKKQRIAQSSISAAGQKELLCKMGKPPEADLPSYLQKIKELNPTQNWAKDRQDINTAIGRLQGGYSASQKWGKAEDVVKMIEKFYRNILCIKFSYNKLYQMSKKILRKGEAPNEWQTQLYDRITKIEAEVLQRIQKLKASNKSYLCEHFSIDNPECEPYDHNVNYYDQFWKRFLLNEIGRQNVAQFRETLQNFQRRLDKIDVLFDQRQKELHSVTKTKQRPQKISERQRQVCHHCGRAYKDQQTLMIHIKIKHLQQHPSQAEEKPNQDIFQEDNDQD